MRIWLFRNKYYRAKSWLFKHDLNLKKINHFILWCFNLLTTACYVYLEIYFLKFLKFIYLFLAVLGLRFCARVFSNCGERGPLFIAVHGPLTVAASLVAEHKL